MTIAAGFRVHNGILLCADTMYTGGMKIHSRKLFQATAGGISCVFALAGHEAYGKMAIEDCQEAIDDIPSRERTFRSVKTALRGAVKGIYDQYVVGSPPDLRDTSHFDLLIGFWLHSDHKVRLFASKVGALNEVNGYECIGSGSYLGHYLIRPAFRAHMDVERTVLLATQVLSAAKRFDEYCGGGSAFMLIGDDGSILPLIHYDVSVSESFIARCEELSRDLFSSIGNTRISDDVFNRNCDTIVCIAKTLRADWQKNQDAWHKVVGVFNQAVQSTPESTIHDRSLPKPSQE